MNNHERVPLLGRNGQSLVDTVYNKLFGMITDGSFSANDRLPSETVLSARFGVSRSVLRQALARLREEQYITSRQGSGSFVADHDYVSDGNPKVQPFLSGEIIGFEPITGMYDLQKYFNFRIAVEGEAAAAAALNRSKAHLDYLFSSIEKLNDTAGQDEESLDLDYRFHLKVAEASENSFFYIVMKMLRNHVITGMTLSRVLTLKQRAAMVAVVVRKHTAIAKAIEAGDEAEARFLMQSHISSARNRLMTGGNKYDYDDE